MWKKETERQREMEVGTGMQGMGLQAPDLTTPAASPSWLAHRSVADECDRFFCSSLKKEFQKLAWISLDVMVRFYCELRGINTSSGT